MSFGYIGAQPTNNSSGNNGVFDLSDIQDLLTDKKYAGNGILVDFLVIGGGGGGGSGHQNGGGGGAGGVRSSVSNKGGSSDGTYLDSKYLLYYGESYEITIGGGTSSGRRNAGFSQLGKIIAVGGGGGESGSEGGGDGGCGGGRRANSYGDDMNNHYAFNDFKGYAGTDAEVDPSGEFWIQGYSNNAGYKGGAGGGNAAYGNTGGTGVVNTIASATDAGTLGIGEVSGSNVYFASGGSEGAANYGSNSNNNSYNSGPIGGGGNSSQNGAANTGGGGGSGYVGGSGGSGIVVIRYANTYPDISTIGGSLTYSGPTGLSGYKYYKFTAGNDTITI